MNDRNHILVYESMYYDCIHDLECMGGNICDLYFANDDIHIISSCMTG